MFKYIKLLLYQHKILKLKTLDDKLNYLLMLDINLYNYNLNIRTSVYEDDIIKSTNLLNKVNEDDIYDKYLDYLKRYNSKSKNIIEWFTDSGNIIDTPEEHFKVWLRASIKINNTYIINKDNVAGGKIYINVNLLKPYINKITFIVDVILKEHFK